MNRLLGLAGVGLAVMLGAAYRAHADASAASVGMGGIQFRKEARISMEKERLQISTEEVRVEYEFLNRTNGDITTDLAFPLADRDCHPWKAVGESDVYNPNFQLWVEGKVQKYKTETQAWVHRRNYTALLRKLGVDIETCGHYQEGRVPDFSRLPEQDLRRLSTLGLLSQDGQIPRWTVRQFYYWTQTFPAGRPLQIAHAYKPGVGNSEQIAVKYLDPAERKKDQVDDPQLEKSCLDPAVGRKLARDLGGPGFETAMGSYVYEWVDYILKTANNWQGPIKDFELTVEQPKAWISFCWNGPIERLGPGHIHVKAANLRPQQNLHILFLPD